MHFALNTLIQRCVSPHPCLRCKVKRSNPAKTSTKCLKNGYINPLFVVFTHKIELDCANEAQITGQLKETIKWQNR